MLTVRTVSLFWNRLYAVRPYFVTKLSHELLRVLMHRTRRVYCFFVFNQEPNNNDEKNIFASYCPLYAILFT